MGVVIKFPKPHISETDRVSHRRFGKGVVVQVLPWADGWALTIDFERVGRKYLMAECVKRERA